MSKYDIKYLIPSDDNEDSPEVSLCMDDASDLTIKQDTAVLMLTLPQSYALHKALGQTLMRHQRSWGPAAPPQLRTV